jgi:hypothetical protein
LTPRSRDARDASEKLINLAMATGEGESDKPQIPTNPLAPAAIGRWGLPNHPRVGAASLAWAR